MFLAESQCGFNIPGCATASSSFSQEVRTGTSQVQLSTGQHPSSSSTTPLPSTALPWKGNRVHANAAVISLPASVLFPGTPLGSQVSATLWGCSTSTGSATWQTLLRNSGHLPALQWYHMLVGISPSQRCPW